MSLALEAALVAEEKSDFTLSWLGDWVEYSEAYLQDISRRYMGGAVSRACAGDAHSVKGW